MPRIVSYIALLLCLAALRLPAGADPTHVARTAIQVAYAGMDKATNRRDAAAYSVYLTSDFVGLDEKETNTVGKAKTLQALRQAFAAVHTAASTTQVLTLVLQDGGAVVTTHSVLTLSGTKNGQPCVIRSENQVRDFWVPSGGRWRLKRERVMSAAQTVNDRPVPSP